MTRPVRFIPLAILPFCLSFYHCSDSNDRPDQPEALLRRYDSLMALPEEEETDVEPVSTIGAFQTGSHSYNGTINNKLAIEMNIEVAADGSVTGEYWYTKNRVPIELRGTIKNGTISLEEFSEGARTGIFSGSYQTESLLTGTWSAPDGSKTFPFTLTGTVNNTQIAMAASAPSPSSTDNKSTGSYSIDQYLDDYERYLMKVMKSMKKMQANDPQGIQEYTDAMEQAQNMSRKLDGMKDEMEPRHLKRMMELNERIAKAAQGM